MSKRAIVHASLIQLLSNVRSAERLAFRVKDNIDDLNSSDFRAFRFYLNDITECVNSLNFTLDFISACFLPDSNEDSKK